MQVSKDDRSDAKAIITSLETAKCHEKLLAALVTREHKAGPESKKQLLLLRAREGCLMFTFQVC